MYPLRMSLSEGIGYAVANDAAEHEALTARGYVPPFAGPPGEPSIPLTPQGEPSIDKPKRGRPRKVTE